MKKLKGCAKKKRCLHSSGRPLSLDLDKAVLEFLMEERAAGRPVSNKDLRSKALELSSQFAVPSTFKASPMWLQRWKKRSKISLRCGTNDAQKIPEDYEGILHDFRASIIKLSTKHGLGPAQVVNMDQTMCRFDMTPSRTNDVTGKRSIRITSTKAKKKGYTVALAARGSGEKFPALIVFKERGGQLGPRVRKSLVEHSNVRVSASTNGWMTAPVYHWWLRNVYQPEFETTGGRLLLVVDNFKPHLSKESQNIVVNECNSDVVFVPAGCTPLVQPMDVSINRPFKVRMREMWVEWFRNHTAVTPRGNLKQPTRQNAIDWVSAAWDAIPESIISESFILCGITATIECFHMFRE